MYRISSIAQEQLREIATYWYTLSRDRAATNRVVGAIREKMRQLGENPTIGTPLENTPYRVGYATKNMRFAIYYRETGPRSIFVVLIKDTKQPRPSPEELEQNDPVPNQVTLKPKPQPPTSKPTTQPPPK